MIKILVVDDEAGFVETLLDFLNHNEGVKAFGATNSTQAFEVLEREKPDILLLDINLHEHLTGLDVHKKAMEILPNARSVIISGNIDTNDTLVEECKHLGITKLLPKPISFMELNTTLKELIGAT